MYVGQASFPPQYPTIVCKTPGTFFIACSGPQNHPEAKNTTETPGLENSLEFGTNGHGSRRSLEPILFI